MTDLYETKPCAYCGPKPGAPRVVGFNVQDTSIWYVQCKDCGARGPFADSRQLAIAKWDAAYIKMKRIAELEAERDMLFEENATISDREAEAQLEVRRLTDELRTAKAEIANLKGVCKEHNALLANAVPFEEHAEVVRNAFGEGWEDYIAQRLCGVNTGIGIAWEESDAKARLDERGSASVVPITLRNAGPGKPLHDEDPTV